MELFGSYRQLKRPCSEYVVIEDVEGNLRHLSDLQQKYD